MKKKLMMAVAMLAVVLVVRGNAFGECIWSCNFEGTAAGAHLTGSEEVQGHYIYSGYGDDDESVVETHSSGAGKYLGLETEGGTTWFSVLTLKDDKLGGYFEPGVGSSIDVDAMMMFTLTEDTPSFSDMPDMLVGEQPANANVLSPTWKRHEGDMLIIISRGMSMFIDDKISIGRYVDDVTTNWCVLAGMDGDGGAEQGTFTLAAANPSESLPDSSKQEWIRVTVRALNDGSEHGIGFEIYMNGIKAAANGKSVFRAVPSASNRTGVAAVGLRGTGGIDDLSFASTVTNLIAPEIRNVTAKQRYPWSGLVDITCEVSGIDGADNGLYFTAAAVDTDAGTTNNVTHLWVVQNGIKTNDREVHTNGTYQLLWDAQAELGAILCSNMVMRINLKEHKSVQLWENGLYWADTNIGAVEPWEYGYYFWWGDTIGCTCENGQWLTNDGSSSTFSFGSANTPTYGKGTADLQSEGWIAAHNTLVLGHDAAHVLWGGNWRLPTTYEFNDLLANCDWNWTTIHGVNGYVVRGRGNYSSNSIFLPAAGYGSDTSLDNAGSQGYYWSATSCYREHTDDYHDSWSIIFGSDYYGADYFSRYFAQSVRPVQGFAGAVVGIDRAVDSVPFLLDTVTCATCGDDLYCVIDLTDGSNATAYPISYLTDVPSDGWTDEYKTTKLVLRKIDAGTFNTVYYSSTVISKPFYIGVFEVTQQQYELVMGDNPCSVTSYGKGDNYPVHYISYNDIRGSVIGASWPISATVDRNSFLGKIQSRTGIDFDLPTEAQWQYACRSGTTTAFSFGDEEDGRYMWSSVNSSSTSHPVGMKSPNAWGLYDMHGNVWEWCLDWWSSTGTGGTYTDPTGPLSGVHRLLHGGSWYRHASYGMSSNVLDEDPSVRNQDYGFRLCCPGELTIKTADEVRLEGAFARLSVEVEPNDEGGWKVTITNDINSADLPIEIPDNVGSVTIDLNGHDLIGGDGSPAIRIVPDVGDGEPTVLTVITTSGDATIQGGDGAPATEVVEGIRDGVAFNFGESVIVKSGIKPEIRNVTAKQRYPWNGLVDITCEVSGIDGTTNGLKFAVAAVDADSGTTNKVLHFWVVQDGTNSTDYAVHTNGDYRIVWDAQADLGEVRYSNMVVRLALENEDVHQKVQLWENGPYWATTNIGADEPWERGYYFWWGDTVGYKRENNVWVASDGSSSNFSFNDGNAHTCNKEIDMLKSEGWITADNTLVPEHDAAFKKWGGGWRMPTNQELVDLCDKCDWFWTTSNDVYGYVIKGKGDYSLASIFLPAAGSAGGTSLNAFNTFGNYWSSVPYTTNNKSWGLGFMYIVSSSTVSHNVNYGVNRSQGRPVRPVQGFADSAAEVGRAGESMPFLLDMVTCAACGDDLYCVIDLTDGPNATAYPVSYLSEVPSGGWTDEYKTTKLVLRKILAGTFSMSGTLPVTISKPFYMGIFEVTQKQYELVTGRNPSQFTNALYYATRPVERVSYNDIRGSSLGVGWPKSSAVDGDSFLGKIRSRTGLGLDLPTEAQWEYACRAGTTSDYNNGKNRTGQNSDVNLNEVGRYKFNGGYDNVTAPSRDCTTVNGTAAVGSYLPNAWELYDMHGNVWEWCLNWYGTSLSGGADPLGPEHGSSRVVRGGCWYESASDCMSWHRSSSDPSGTNYDSGGFRLCCSAEIPSAISTAEVVLATDSMVYSGVTCEPDVVSVTIGGTVLTKGVDYLVCYADNVNVGTATITLTGTNLYNGTYTTNFTIRPKLLTKGMVEAIGNHPYTGKAQTPKPTVTDAERGAMLREGVDYTLSYANNTAIGEGIVTVTGKGNYTGSIAMAFVIEPSEGWELEERLGGAGKVESDGVGGWIVTITNDVDATDLPIEIPDDFGPVTVDLNGHDLVGDDGRDGARPSQDAGEDGRPAIRIEPGGGDGEPTVITIVSTGGDATVKGGDGGAGNPGGNGAPAIEVADGAKNGVLINIGTGVTVQGGDGGASDTGRGGDGGAGIVWNVGTNDGTIVGGNGGASDTGDGGNGGAGVDSNVDVNNGGISGGVGGGSEGGTDGDSGTGVTGDVGTDNGVVLPYALTEEMVGEITLQPFTGAEVTPEVQVFDAARNHTLEEGTDYVLRWADNIRPGTASVTVTGKGNYLGEVTRTFAIGTPVEHTLTVGEYFYATLAELGYNVPTNGTPYSVVAKGLPAGLKLKYNPAWKNKKGKVIIKAKAEWWIEGVPTAAMDFFENPPYLVITTNGVAGVHSLPIEVVAQDVVVLEDLALGQSVNEQFYLPGVTNGWTVSGLPTGLKYTAKLLTTKKKAGKKTVVTTNALPYSVYGKTTKAGLFTITAKKKKGSFYETLKYRVFVRPKEVNAAVFGEDLTNIVTMAYVPVTWDLAGGSEWNGGHAGRVTLPAVAAVGGKVAKVSGLPPGLTFAASDMYAYTNAKKKTGKYLKQTGQTIVGTPTKPGTYVVTFTKNVKEKVKGKMTTVAKTAQILWVVEPNNVKVELGFNTAGGVIEGGVVGLKYGDLLAFSATEGATVKASGLPAGMKLVKVEDGRYAFTGYTTKAGMYLVTVKATLKGKIVTQRLALKVEGLPAWAKGTFNGCVRGSGTLAASGEEGSGESVASPRGLATATVSAAGKISGKFQESGTNWTFSAVSYTDATSATASAGGVFGGFVCSNVVAQYAYKVTETVKGKKKTVTKYVKRMFHITVAPVPVVPNGAVRGVVRMVESGGCGATALLPGEVGAEIEAWQNLWGRNDYKALGKALFSTKSGKKTLTYKMFTIKSGTPEGEAIGLGPGMSLAIKVTTTGAVTATMTFDTGKTKKDPKTKKTVKVYYKPMCQSVVIPRSAADAEDFTGDVLIYFAPSRTNNFPGFSKLVEL